MASKWQNQDSARTMTNKFNEVVDDVKLLFSEKLNSESIGVEISSPDVSTINKILGANPSENGEGGV